jgi:hypothetical protein
VPHHGQVVGDDEVGEPELLLQVLQQVDDLRLHRHVERRDGLVGHDQLRVHRQRPRDADALALAAGELVRVLLQRRGGQADGVEQLDAAGPRPLLVGRQPVRLHALQEQLLDGLARVEAAQRVLEHHLHVAALAAQVLALERGQVDTTQTSPSPR